MLSEFFFKNIIREKKVFIQITIKINYHRERLSEMDRKRKSDILLSDFAILGEIYIRQNVLDYSPHLIELSFLINNSQLSLLSLWGEVVTTYIYTTCFRPICNYTLVCDAFDFSAHIDHKDEEGMNEAGNMMMIFFFKPPFCLPEERLLHYTFSKSSFRFISLSGHTKFSQR